MDFGSILGGIGHFFGGLFGGGDDEQKKKQQQQQAQQQRQAAPAPQVFNPIGGSTNVPVPAGVQPPKQFTPATTPNVPQLAGVTINSNPQNTYKGADLTGLSDEDRTSAQKFIDSGRNATPFINAARSANAAQQNSDYNNSWNGKLGNFGKEVGKELIGGAQQGAGLIGDVATQGGGLLSQAADSLNPLLSEQQRQRLQANDLNATAALQQKLRGLHDVSGNAIEGTAGADASAAKIANGTANIGDVGNVGLTGLNTGLAATMFDPASYVPLLSKLRGGVNPLIHEGEAILANDAAPIAERPLNTPPKAPELPPAPETRLAETPTPTEPGNPITTSPTTNKPAAITSANPDFQPPAVKPPAPFTPPTETGIPEMSGVQPIQAPLRPAEPVTAVPAPTAEQQTAAIQDTLNKEAAKPPVQPAPVEAAPVEAPAVTKAKAMAAEATPPPSPESLAEADAIAKNDAPTEEIAKSVPSYTSPKKSGRASVPGQRSVYYNTGDANLDGIVHDSIIAHKGTADTAEARATALDKAGITQAQRAQIRNIAVNAVDKTTGRISAEGKQAIEDVITGRGAEKTAPVTTEPPVAEAPAGETVDTTPVDEALTSNPNKLGTITHNAVLDGSINTPEGVTKAINDVTTAAHNAAEESGAPLSDIIKKGQAAWEHSSARGKDLTPVEAQHGYNDRKGGYAGDPSFTPEQQQVYKDYAQEISTLRDRSGHSLTGGHQGAWYGPRQSLVDGKSAEFNPELINEISRKGQSSRTPVDSLDTSATPYEHAIQRYANAPDAGAQRIVNAIEKDPVTGAPNGVHLPDTAKQQLEDSLKAITEKRDQAARLEHEGNHDEAKQIRDSIVGDINNTFNKVIDDIPGTGSTRRAAINNVKAIREPYRQSMMQVLSLSNVVNRVADQGGKLVALAKRPLERGLEKVVGGHYANIARDAGTDVNTLNTNKEALTAARSIAKGSQGRQIIENAKTAQAMAGAGRGVVGKAAAKVAEIPSTLNAAATQLGDLHNMNVVDALKVGASLPGAKNLKTVADYQKYFGDWMKTDGYKQALSGAEHDNNRQIGMSGGKGDNMQSGGKASRIISKYLDNGVKTAAEHYGFNPENPLIRNANDYVKGNVTGYAGVGSRILGYGKDALTLGKLREAGKVAASGSPDAVARATQIASKQIASTIATYGTAGAAALAAKSGVIGYTGPQPAAGSSDSAYNKSYTVPANQWYINLPNGQRAYFNATRTFNTPGLAADVVGTAMTSKDPASATGAIAGQVYNQAGGSSLPQTIVNATDFAKDPTGQTPAGKYASEQLQQTAAPSTGILNNIANWQDPTKRAPTNFVDDLKSNLPVLRSQVPAAKDSQGNDIANSKQLSGGSSVLSIGTNPDASAAQGADPVATEINRLQKISGNVFPTSTNKNAKSDTSTYASMLLKDPIYTSLDDSGKAEMLKSILAGTSTKGIDPSLSSTDKQALMDASLLGSAKTQAWLDNNDNNSNYKTALYNNAQASKTLTADDNNMNHKTGLKYQMVRAQTDQKLGADSDLKQLYHDTSTTDMKNMLNPENENYNPDQAAKVYAYDQALASAHVSEASNTDSTKYNMAAILKSIAKANGPKGGKKTFGFANLPSTLVGTGSGGTGSGNGGYAADAPLFTPIASLKTPAIAAIPNGRTISVQKGEHL